MEVNRKYGFIDKPIKQKVNTNHPTVGSHLISLKDFEKLNNSNRTTGKFVANENFLDGNKSMLIHKNGGGGL